MNITLGVVADNYIHSPGNYSDVICKMASKSATSDIACQVCQQQFKAPKLLPCLHSFCKECLDKLVAKGKLRK